MKKNTERACGAPSFGGLWHASSQGSSRNGDGSKLPNLLSLGSASMVSF